jgi:hypothetical protein
MGAYGPLPRDTLRRRVGTCIIAHGDPMTLFVVRHHHEAERCPAVNPYAGATLLNYLSRPNVRQQGIEIKGEAVVRGEHTLYMIALADLVGGAARAGQPSLQGRAVREGVYSGRFTDFLISSRTSDPILLRQITPGCPIRLRKSRKSVSVTSRTARITLPARSISTRAMGTSSPRRWPTWGRGR